MLLFKHVLPSSASEPLTLDDTRLTQPELTGSLVARILICFPKFSYRSRERRQSVFTRSAPLWTASQAACRHSYTDLLIRIITPFDCSEYIPGILTNPFDVYSYMQTSATVCLTTHCRIPGLSTMANATYNVMVWTSRLEKIFGTFFIVSALGT